MAADSDPLGQRQDQPQIEPARQHRLNPMSHLVRF